MTYHDQLIRFHLEQAERYSRLLADPMHVSEYSARFLAQNITYHRQMADWYEAEPQPPEEDENAVPSSDTDGSSDADGNQSSSRGEQEVNEDHRTTISTD